jgi:NADP-dependent 3-hydroxy acid dehydrogenase YdfG
LKSLVKASVDPRRSIVVITGCDSGFGQLTVNLLQPLGYIIVATCLTKGGMKQYKDMENVYPVQFDITKDVNIEALKKVVEKLASKGSGLKLWALVNNAGIAPIGHFDILKSTTYRQVMDINYFGIINLTVFLLVEHTLTGFILLTLGVQQILILFIMVMVLQILIHLIQVVEV